MKKKSRSASKKSKPSPVKAVVKRGGPTAGLVVVWPKGVEARYGVSAPTRWRWERDKKLPRRDVFINGVPIGWKPATLEASERGE